MADIPCDLRSSAGQEILRGWRTFRHKECLLCIGNSWIHLLVSSYWLWEHWLHICISWYWFPIPAATNFGRHIFILWFYRLEFIPGIKTRASTKLSSFLETLRLKNPFPCLPQHPRNTYIPLLMTAFMQEKHSLLLRTHAFTSGPRW